MEVPAVYGAPPKKFPYVVLVVVRAAAPAAEDGTDDRG